MDDFRVWYWSPWRDGHWLPRPRSERKLFVSKICFLCMFNVVPWIVLRKNYMCIPQCSASATGIMCILRVCSKNVWSCTKGHPELHLIVVDVLLYGSAKVQRAKENLRAALLASADLSIVLLWNLDRHTEIVATHKIDAQELNTHCKYYIHLAGTEKVHIVHSVQMEKITERRESGLMYSTHGQTETVCTTLFSLGTQSA